MEGLELGTMIEDSTDREHVDAGRIKSREPAKGWWMHAFYHLTTTIATPAAFAPLPSAVAALGWEAGALILVLDTLVSSYCSFLLASLWNFEGFGKLNVTYGALARTAFGPSGYWAVCCLQQVASIGNNIAIQIVAGISMKTIYTTYSGEDSWTLQDFIVAFGLLQLALSQFPSIHSLRVLNMLCTVCTIGFTICAIGLSVHNGKQLDRKSIGYGIQGSSVDRVFGVFSALGTMAFSFGDAMLPEIQSTIREPARQNMYKGVGWTYSLLAATYWPVAFIGYWAFGSTVQPYLVNSFTGPSWAVTLANVLAVIQIAGCYQIYCRPTYVYLEIKYLDAEKSPFNIRNWPPRLLITGLYMVLVTLVAAAMPFFGDFVTICGAIGFTPLDFIIPILAFLKLRKPQNRLLWVVNLTIVTVYTFVGIAGTIGGIRLIVEDTRTYKFFNNL